MKQIAKYLAVLLCAVMTLSAFSAPERQNSLSAAAVTVSEEQAVYQKLLAMKSQYPDGRQFDNNTPYSLQSNPYTWEAARQRTAGCAAFAAILSDAAFGTSGSVKEFANVRDARAGDVLRYYAGSNQHSVIVLRRLSDSVEVAEANVVGSDRIGRVKWGRTISFTELQNNQIYFYTRYTESSAAVSGLRGDVDGSGQVSVEDAPIVLKAYTRKVSGQGTGFDDTQTKRADADLNGQISVEDAQLILLYYTRNVVSQQNVPWEKLI
jgi:hypothetical protein